MSLRHTRLLRIISITLRGEQVPWMRAFAWRGYTYLIDRLEREGIRWRPYEGVASWGHYPGWDRRWKPCRGFASKYTVRDRTRLGAELRRMRREVKAINARGGLRGLGWTIVANGDNLAKERS